MAVTCCNDRPRRYLNQQVEKIEGLAPLLERDSSSEDPREYRCKVCGQRWFETMSPFMHSDIWVVYKEGTSSNPLLNEDGISGPWLVPPARAPGRADDAGYFAVVLITGLLTLPAGDLAARQNWFVGWCVAGFLILMVVTAIKKPSKPPSP